MAKFVFSPANDTSVSIKIDTMPTILAPAPVFLEATGHTGFSTFEGSGSEYDGAFHEIYHVWTVKGQPLSTYGVPQNFLSEWNNANVAYGPRVAFRFPDPGEYIIELWCIDRNGVTARAETNTIKVWDPDLFYVGASTICFSDDPSETWADEKPGCQRVTSWAALTGGLLRGDNGTAPHRVLFKAGSTVEATASIGIDSAKDLSYIGAWGTGAKPIIQQKTRLGEFVNNIFYYVGGVQNDQITATGLRFEAPYDSTAEVGYAGSHPIRIQPIFGKDMYVHVHDCEWDGFDNFSFSTNGSANPTWIMVSDCFGTNWRNYAMFGGGGADNVIAAIGNRFQQHVDALGGVVGKGGMGNQHGPMRIERADALYVACCDMFSRNGWSAGINNTNGFQEPSDQPCMRFLTSGDVGAQVVVDRVVCEGGFQSMRISSFGTGQTVNPGNFLVDRALLLGTAKSAAEMISVGHGGTTVRNVYGWVPDVAQRTGDTPRQLVELTYQDNRGANNENQSMTIYNCTAVSLRPGSEWADVTAASEFTDVVVENNLVFAPNMTPPINSDPVNLTAGLTGVMPRFKGVKFNFVPQSMPFGASYLPGSDLADGGSFVIPYSEITDLIVGEDPAAATVTDQAYWQQVETDSANAGYTPRHTINARGIKYSELGEFTVAYEPSGVRITNTSGETWAIPVNANQVWLLRLDRSVNIPAMLTQFASPATVPLPQPDFTQSEPYLGRRSPADFLFYPRNGNGIKGTLLP